MRKSLKLAFALSALVITSAIISPVQAADSISGAGSSFAYPIYSKWAEAYKTKSGVALNYQSIGSGAGIKLITQKTVDFGASDMPLTVEKLKELGLVQWPMVMGGVVPVLNVPGIHAGQLKLNGPVLADIYLGKIKHWNDAAIAKLNPGVKLPKLAITPAARSDGSGTSYIFTTYLSQVSPEWKEKVGVNTSVNWPAGVGGKGNEGVAANVLHIKGAIGYVEYAYALQNKMTYALMENAAHKYVKPTAASFQAAAAHADWAHTPGFNLMLTQQPGAESWPITGATFVLVQAKAENAEATREVLKFFDWSYKNGDAMAKSLDYVPMPKNVVKVVEETWHKEIADAKGESMWVEAVAKK
jgi:phosphate transport system substrate-binding protein